MRYAFDLEVERRHVGEEARVDERIGVSACLGTICGSAVEEVSDGESGL